MYAIIQTGGKQVKCSPNDVLTVERLSAEPGKPHSFKDVLLVADGEKVTVGTPHVKGAEVICEVLGETKGKKVIAFMYRRRKDSKRIRGHRQLSTQLRVKEIKF
jgi:large subunit ribosomal protein L21